MRSAVPINNQAIFFCEDIREEANDKVSYMGVLSPGLHVKGFPIVFPTLCVAMMSHITDDKQVDLECELTSDAALPLPPLYKRTFDRTDDEDAWQLKINLKLRNLRIDQPTEIKVRFRVNDTTAFGTLRIREGEGVGAIIEDVVEGVVKPPHRAKRPDDKATSRTESP